jgi:hypothetical protein
LFKDMTHQAALIEVVFLPGIGLALPVGPN